MPQQENAAMKPQTAQPKQKGPVAFKIPSSSSFSQIGFKKVQKIDSSRSLSGASKKESLIYNFSNPEKSQTNEEFPQKDSPIEEEENTGIIPNRSRTGTGKEKRPNLFDDEPSENKISHSSTQVTDHSLLEKQRNVFRRVVRLRQICDEVEQKNTSDNSVQIKKENADKAREDLVLSRMRIEARQQQLINETMQRNKIEKMELQDEIDEKRELVAKEKAERIRRIKEERERKMEKFQSSMQFGKAFMSASRAAARIVEVANKQKQQSSSSLAIKNTVSNYRASSLKSKESAKTKLKEIEEQRKRKAALDKLAVETRREKRQNAALDKLEALYAEKKVMRERSKLSTERQKPEFVYIEPQKNVLIDEIEETYNTIVEEVGANIGFTEGHILAEMMQSLMDE